MPSFHPNEDSPSSILRWRPVSCASRPRSILGSLAMARDCAMARADGGSGHVEEADRDLAEPDLVAVPQHGLADPRAVDDHAVEAAVIEDHVVLPAPGDD